MCESFDVAAWLDAQAVWVQLGIGILWAVLVVKLLLR